jgi:2-dehydro-3-deoxyphosphooctonate aldolase (KDO 8-P synthase)
MRETIFMGSVPVGGKAPFTLIAGPCVIESLDVLKETAGFLKDLTGRLGIGFIFKSSFDKANRSSIGSFRGPGFEPGLELLSSVKSYCGVPVISDIHEPWQAAPAAKVLDALQIPAFLARQTDLLIAAARSGLPVNVKKGQFMAPEDMEFAIKKMTGQPGFMGVSLCERGVSFGYRNLVVDIRSFVIMRDFSWPVFFDATHSVQLPSAAGGKSGGERRFIPALARAAVAAGVDGIFMETHPRPDEALCDSANQWPLYEIEPLLKTLINIHTEVKEPENDR